MAEMHDAGPEEAALWRHVRKRSLSVFFAHGYHEARPAIIERRALLVQAGVTDMVVLDEEHALRPDPQFSLARLIVAQPAPDHGLRLRPRWVTAGTVFDPRPFGDGHERAWQSVAGLVVGSIDPTADAECAALLHALAKDLDLVAPHVAVSTLGSDEDLDGYRRVVGELLALRCERCVGSSEPLAFLHCEDDGCRELTRAAPPYRGFLGIEAQKRHESVLATLEASGFPANDDPNLIFGSGRYRGTLFELRAQNRQGRTIHVARGGRRDALLQRIGGPSLPALGVTLGVALTASCVAGDGQGYESACEVLFATRGAAARAWALAAASAGRALGFRTDVELRDLALEEQIDRAKRLHARVVVVASERDRKQGRVAVRDMRSAETRTVAEEQLPIELKRLLR